MKFWSAKATSDPTDCGSVVPAWKPGTRVFLRFQEAEALIKEFRRRRDQLTETARFQMEALRKAGDEVRQFHEFYPNKKGINGNHDANAVIYLTETEVQEILEVEKMLIRFESFYAAGVWRKEPPLYSLIIQLRILTYSEFVPIKGAIVSSTYTLLISNYDLLEVIISFFFLLLGILLDIFPIFDDVLFPLYYYL